MCLLKKIIASVYTNESRKGLFEIEQAYEACHFEHLHDHFIGIFDDQLAVFLLHIDMKLLYDAQAA